MWLAGHENARPFFCPISRSNTKTGTNMVKSEQERAKAVEPVHPWSGFCFIGKDEYQQHD
jgi:hypothetical protein